MENSLLDDNMTIASQGLSGVTFAGFWIRVGATLVDILVLLPIYVIAFYNMYDIKSLVLAIVLSIVGVLYKPVMEWKKSATLGKMAVKIKLVDEDGNNINGEQALTRYLPWIINFVISTAINIQVFMHPKFDQVDGFMEMSLLMQESSLNSVNTIYSIIFFVIIVVVAFDARKQGLHDKLANTYCIKVEK